MKISAKGNKAAILSNKIVVIGISLHNPNHNGHKFKYIIDWVNSQQNFTKCYIDLSDTLYRHNYLLTDNSITKSEALEKARRNGDKWIDRSLPYLEKLNVPNYVIRWDTWRNNPYFESTYNLFKEAYKRHQPFKLCVNNDISSFFLRKGISSEVVFPKEFKLSLNFLLEELTCHTLMYKNIKAANVYPGKMPSCYKFVREQGVPGIKDALSNMTFTRLVYHDIESDRSDLLQNYSQTKVVTT